MEILLQRLGDYGLPGLLMAAIIGLYWHMVRVQIPSLLQFTRKQLADERTFCSVERALDRDAYAKGFKSIATQLDRIESKIEH